MSAASDLMWRDPEVLQERLVELVTCAREVDVRKYETAPRDHVHAELMPASAQLVDNALTLTQRVADAWDAAAGPDPDEWASPSDTVELFRDFDRLGETAANSGPRVADVAFMTAMSLRTRRRSLEALSEVADSWAIVAACGSALRQVHKGAAAIDAALAGAHGLVRRVSTSTELADALETRRRYSELRRVIASASRATDDELRGALRQVGGAIAILIGKSIYPSFRISDRIQLRAMQARVLDWLRNADADLRDGRRTLQDLLGFSDMLAMVSRRQELVEHDSALAELLGAQLSPTEPPSAEQREALARLRGRDDTLDALLDACDPVPGATWLQALHAAQLLGAGGGR